MVEPPEKPASVIYAGLISIRAFSKEPISPDDLPVENQINVLREAFNQPARF